MENLKTACIVLLLLGALYGAYQFLNYRDVPPPREVQAQFEQGIAPPSIEFGSSTGEFSSGPVEIPPSSANPATVSPAQFTPPTPEGAFPPVESTATRLQPPSFAVLPDATTTAVSPRAMLPTDSAEGMTAPQVTATPIVDVATVGHDQQPESAYRQVAAGETNTSVATNTGTRAPVDPAAASSSRGEDPFPGIQSNPFYRPSESSPPVTSADRTATRDLGHEEFVRAWGEARDLVEQGKVAAALAKLTSFYQSPDLSRAEQEQLLKTLDSLAGRVIYSTEHYLEKPYVVRNSETLMDIAAQYNVDWRLLQNINGIRDPLVLVPKTQLKVLRGPFHAEVNLTTSELTLFVDEYYAGRFPVSIGRDPPPSEQPYTVREKRDGKDYYLRDGRTVPARSPSNPYGAHWIDLGQEVCIHGSAQRDVSPDLGCISLSPLDAADVYGILTPGSTVTIRR